MCKIREIGFLIK